MEVQEVKYREEATTPLSESEMAAVKNRGEALQKLLASQATEAKYRIEIQFLKNRSTWKPTPGIMSFWESNGRLDAEADTKLYICPSKMLKRSECEAFIPDYANGEGGLICAKCGGTWNHEQVRGEIFFNLTPQNWAHVLVLKYAMLENNADICIKHAREDIRVISAQEQERQRGGELLTKMRSKRVPYLYPLRNIIKDVANGSDLYARFLAFLTA